MIDQQDRIPFFVERDMYKHIAELCAEAYKANDMYILEAYPKIVEIVAGETLKFANKMNGVYQSIANDLNTRMEFDPTYLNTHDDYNDEY